MTEQERNIRLAFPERGHRHTQHIQAIIEILPEFLLPDQLFEVLVRRRQDPHVGLERLRPPDPFEFMLLQHA